MTLRQTTQQLIAEAEALSGYPVEIKVDATLPSPAALRMARGSTALHTISIQPDPMAREGRDGTGRDGTGREEIISYACNAVSSCASSPPRRSRALT